MFLLLLLNTYFKEVFVQKRGKSFPIRAMEGKVIRSLPVLCQTGERLGSKTGASWPECGQTMSGIHRQRLWRELLDLKWPSEWEMVCAVIFHNKTSGQSLQIIYDIRETSPIYLKKTEF